VSTITALLYAGGTALIAIVAAFLKGRVSGAAKERAKQAAAEKKARDVADQVDNDIGALPPGKAREELKTWSKR
jgi:hypothetical protein